MFALNSLPSTVMAVPDVCKLPPFATPAPLPNIAIVPTGVPVVPNILVGGAPVQTISTLHTPTNGDEAGTFGGLISQTIMGSHMSLIGAFTVLYGSLPVSVALRSVGISNLGNASALTPMPNQLKVLILAP